MKLFQLGILALAERGNVATQSVVAGLEVRMGERVKDGTIYTTLTRMERDGLIRSKHRKEVRQSGPARRFISLTPSGRSTLAKARRALG